MANEITKRKIGWISILIMTGLAIWLVFFVTRHWEEISKISLERPGLLVLILFLQLLSTLVFSVEQKIFLEPLCVRLGQFESFALTLATNFHNQISPRGGLVSRGLYLKKRRDCSYTKYLVIMSGRFLINFVVAGSSGIAACILLNAVGYKVQSVLPLFFVAVVLAALVPILVPLRLRQESSGFVRKKLAAAAEAWNAVRSSHITVRNTIFTNLIRLFIQTLIWSLCFRSFGQTVDLSQGFILAVVTDLSLVIAITPGGLGIQDAAAIVTSQAIQLPMTYTIAAVVTRRITYTVVLLLFGLPSTYFMLVRNQISLSDDNLTHRT